MHFQLPWETTAYTANILIIQLFAIINQFKGVK